MKRSITNKINWCLDNLLIPGLRDNKLFMSILFRIALGPKYKYYMEFKEKVPELTEEEINRYYELLADTFMKRGTDNNDQCVDYICKACCRKDIRILDAACGRGYLINKVYEASQSKECYAVDIVAPEEQTPNIHYVSASLTTLPFEDNFFDIVLCTHALEHIKDNQKALQELRRVCKDKLLIVVPKQREYRYTFDLHIHFFPYLYSVKGFINNPKANIMEIEKDWMIEENR